MAGHNKKILSSFVCAGYANGKRDSCEVSFVRTREYSKFCRKGALVIDFSSAYTVRKLGIQIIRNFKMAFVFTVNVRKLKIKSKIL